MRKNIIYIELKKKSCASKVATIHNKRRKRQKLENCKHHYYTHKHKTVYNKKLDSLNRE